MKFAYQAKKNPDLKIHSEDLIFNYIKGNIKKNTPIKRLKRKLLKRKKLRIF